MYFSLWRSGNTKASVDYAEGEYLGIFGFKAQASSISGYFINGLAVIAFFLLRVFRRNGGCYPLNDLIIP